METSNNTPVTLSHETANQLKTLFANSECDFNEPQDIEKHVWRMLSDSIAHNIGVDDLEKGNMVTSCKTLLECWQVMQRLHKEMASQVS